MEEEAEPGRRNVQPPESAMVHVARAPSISWESSDSYNADSDPSSHNQVLPSSYRDKLGASKPFSYTDLAPVLLMVLLLLCVILQLVIIFLRVTDNDGERCGLSRNCLQLQEPPEDPTQADPKNRSQLVNQCLNEEIAALKRQATTLERQLKALQPREQKGAKAFSAFAFLRDEDLSGGKIYISQGVLANYNDAVELCTKLGGQLASPRNVKENNAVYAIRSQYGTSPFLGINDIQTEGTFRYPSGEPINYTNWNFPEPNNDHGYEDCVEMYVFGTWNDKNCKEVRLVICEF